MQHCSRCWPGFIVPALYKVRGEGTPGTAGPYGGFGGRCGKTRLRMGWTWRSQHMIFEPGLAEMLQQLAQRHGCVWAGWGGNRLRCSLGVAFSISRSRHGLLVPAASKLELPAAFPSFWWWLSLPAQPHAGAGENSLRPHRAPCTHALLFLLGLFILTH